MKPDAQRGRRFLIDENLPRDLALQLTAAGNDAVHVHDIGLRGEPDEIIFAHAQLEGRAVVTGDVEFGSLHQYPPPHAGILVARLPDTLSRESRLRIIVDAVSVLANDPLENATTIIEIGRVRIHR